MSTAADSFFAEKDNCAPGDITAGVCNGDPLATAPDLAFGNYLTGLTGNQYYQYKAYFISDDPGTACTGAPCLPELMSVGIGSASRYRGDSPDVKNRNLVPFTALVSATETGAGGCTRTYQVSADGTNYYYYSGGLWLLASSAANSNDITSLNTGLSSFASQVGTGNLYWKAFFNSDTTQDCSLSQLDFVYQ